MKWDNARERVNIVFWEKEIRSEFQRMGQETIETISLGQKGWRGGLEKKISYKERQIKIQASCQRHPRP